MIDIILYKENVDPAKLGCDYFNGINRHQP